MIPSQNHHTKSTSSHKHARQQISQLPCKPRCPQRSHLLYTPHPSHAYNLAKSPPSTNLMVVIWNLQSFIHTEHTRVTIKATQSMQHTKKWLNMAQIHPEFYIHLWKTFIFIYPNVQITQTFDFNFAQYMDNRQKNVPWPQIYTNLNYMLCPWNNIDILPHLLFICENKFLKGFQIARRNVVAHQLANLLK